MRQVMFVVLGLLAAGSLPVQAASLVNGDFETGNLMGWSTSVPSNAVVDAEVVSGSWTATQGDYFAQLVTDNKGANLSVTMFQSVDLKAGDRVSFNYFFFQNDPQFSNSAVATLGGANVLSVQGAGDVNASGAWSSVTSDPVATDGSYQLNFGIANGGSTRRGIFGIDNITVLSGGIEGPTNPPPSGPIGHAPEPLTLLGLTLGLGSVAGYLRRRQA